MSYINNELEGLFKVTCVKCNSDKVKIKVDALVLFGSLHATKTVVITCLDCSSEKIVSA